MTQKEEEDWTDLTEVLDRAVESWKKNVRKTRRTEGACISRTADQTRAVERATKSIWMEGSIDHQVEAVESCMRTENPQEMTGQSAGAEEATTQKAVQVGTASIPGLGWG